MSLLKNMLNSAFSPARKPSSAASPSAPAGAQREPAQGARAPVRHVWQLLDDETGVQDFDYPDNPRPEIRGLLRQPPRRVLDIGCATGAVGLGLKQAYPGTWVWGCELNPRAAQIARTRLDHVTTVPREQWPASDQALLGEVDTVLLLDVLEHMYNPWAELRHLSETLAAGAQVIVSLPNAGHLNVMAGLAAGTFRYEPAGILDITHIRFFTLQEMRRMFEETGFAIEAETIISTSQGPQVSEFPLYMSSGKLTLKVDSLQEWQVLNAVQIGFRLAARRS